VKIIINIIIVTLKVFSKVSIAAYNLVEESSIHPCFQADESARSLIPDPHPCLGEHVKENTRIIPGNIGAGMSFRLERSNGISDTFAEELRSNAAPKPALA